MVEHFLDITEDICPLTFVKTKLLIEDMAPGDIAVIRLKGAEPLGNVPRSILEYGHEIISLEPAQPDATGQDSVHILTLRKFAPQSFKETE